MTPRLGIARVPRVLDQIVVEGFAREIEIRLVLVSTLRVIHQDHANSEERLWRFGAIGLLAHQLAVRSDGLLALALGFVKLPLREVCLGGDPRPRRVLAQLIEHLDGLLERKLRLDAEEIGFDLTLGRTLRHVHLAVQHAGVHVTAGIALKKFAVGFEGSEDVTFFLKQLRVSISRHRSRLGKRILGRCLVVKFDRAAAIARIVSLLGLLINFLALRRSRPRVASEKRRVGIIAAGNHQERKPRQPKCCTPIHCCEHKRRKGLGKSKKFTRRKFISPARPNAGSPQSPLRSAPTSARAFRARPDRRSSCRRAK